MKTQFTVGLLLVSGLTGACSSYDPNSAQPSPTPNAVVIPNATVSPTVAPTVSPTVTGTKTSENRDGSTTVVTNYSDGTQTETRTFKTGRLASVTRSTDASGKKVARVTYREDSREVELNEPSWVEKSMDATGDALAVAASKTKQGALEVADKAEDVGDATKKGTKKVINEIGDKAEDVGDATKKGAKKVGQKLKDIVN